MVYEVRAWYDGCGCLYTDDIRIKDLAVQSSDLSVTASYFRSTRDTHPFAWDIVGERELVNDLALRFSKRSMPVRV
jgi:hypothetical protein